MGFHIIPLDAEESCIERIRSTEGDLSVHTTLRVIDFNRAKRTEVLRVIVKADKPDGSIDRVRAEFPLRLYTHQQAKSLLKKVGNVFDVVGVYDFDYDFDQPREIDDDLTDAVFVLRRK